MEGSKDGHLHPATVQALVRACITRCGSVATPTRYRRRRPCSQPGSRAGGPSASMADVRSRCLERRRQWRAGPTSCTWATARVQRLARTSQVKEVMAAVAQLDRTVTCRPWPRIKAVSLTAAATAPASPSSQSLCSSSSPHQRASLGRQATGAAPLRRRKRRWEARRTSSFSCSFTRPAASRSAVLRTSSSDSAAARRPSSSARASSCPSQTHVAASSSSCATTHSLHLALCPA